MIRHYIKTAFRNLLKYKAQNIISIIGLSVGILCFSICLYCSRYINLLLFPIPAHVATMWKLSTRKNCLTKIYMLWK